jgi:hypothetical protein
MNVTNDNTSLLEIILPPGKIEIKIKRFINILIN